MKNLLASILDLIVRLDRNHVFHLAVHTAYQRADHRNQSTDQLAFPGFDRSHH